VGERYNYSLDIGKDLDKEGRAAGEAKPAEEPAPDAPQEPDESQPAPRPPDPGEEDINEIITKDIPQLRPREERGIFGAFAIPLCILLLVILASWSLTRTAEMPLLDTLAEEAVERQLEAGIARTIAADNPFMGAAEQQRRAKLLYEQARESETVAREIGGLAAQLKSQYKTPEGLPYFFTPDDYFHFRRTRNILERGHEGETLRDGVPFDTLRDPPFGEPADGRDAFPQFQAAFVRAVRVFADVSAERVLVYAPVVVGRLSLVLFFFLARILLGSTFPAFVAGVVLALHPRFIRLNFAGLPDSGYLNFFLSMASVLLFLCALRAQGRRRLIFLVLTVAALAVFSSVWSGWYYVAAVFVFFGIGLFAVGLVRKARSGSRSSLFALFVIPVALALSLLAASRISFFHKLFVYAHLLPAARTFYPEGFEFVTELQGVSPGELPSLLGGWVLVLFALAGASLLARRIWLATVPQRARERDPAVSSAVFLLAWCVPILVAGVLAYRFLGYAAPAFAAIAAVGAHGLASLLGGVLEWFSEERVSARGKLVCCVMVLLLVGIPMIGGVREAANVLPLMNDGIAETAQLIASQSKPDAVITTWWSTGYLWQAFARRPTAQDGGNFGSPRQWWLARAFTSSDERHARNILRFIYCGGERTVLDAARPALGEFGAHRLALRLVNSTADDIDILVPGGAPVRIEDLRCNPPEAFVVITEDMLPALPTMVEIAGWDFESGSYLPRDSGIISAVRPCAQEGAYVRCANGYAVNLTVLDARKDGSHPAAVHVYRDGEKRVQRFADASERSVLVLFEQADGLAAFTVDEAYSESLLVRIFAHDPWLRFFEPFAVVSKPDRIAAARVAWAGRNLTLQNVAPADASPSELSALLAGSLRDSD
jgi:hypothetical protein